MTSSGLLGFDHSNIMVTQTIEPYDSLEATDYLYINLNTCTTVLWLIQDMEMDYLTPLYNYDVVYL